MQTPLYLKRYPEDLQKKLKLATPLAIEIANRWVLGWPEAVTALIASEEYWEALENQEQQEREVLTQPGNSHLARHEILQEYGLSLSPPAASRIL
ncbi:MAG: hypothetical protein ACXW1Z_22925 [Methylobacter sp.]